MTVLELMFTMLGFALPCLFAELTMSKWSFVPPVLHAEINYVCLNVLLVFALLDATSSFGRTSYSGIQSAARTAVFLSFAAIMAFRRCRPKETRISGVFFLLMVGLTLITFAGGLPR